MENCNLDFIGEVYRGASIALQSISDVMPEIETTLYETKFTTSIKAMKVLFLTLLRICAKRDMKLKISAL